MKKMYSSPDIAFQTLNVNKQGNGACEFISMDESLATSNQCAVKDKVAGIVIFNTDACWNLGGYPSDKEVCYGIPSESFNIHNS